MSTRDEAVEVVARVICSGVHGGMKDGEGPCGDAYEVAIPIVDALLATDLFVPAGELKPLGWWNERRGFHAIAEAPEIHEYECYATDEPVFRRVSRKEAE